MRTTQDSPGQDGSNDATNEEAVQGILQQVRADMQMGSTHGTAETLLRERFDQSQLTVSDQRLAELAANLHENG